MRNNIVFKYYLREGRLRVQTTPPVLIPKIKVYMFVHAAVGYCVGVYLRFLCHHLNAHPSDELPSPGRCESPIVHTMNIVCHRKPIL